MESKIKTIRLYIIGMTCAGCKTRIENNLCKLKGVKSVNVSLRERSAELVYDSDKLTLREIKSAIEALGYTVMLKKPSASVFRTVGLTVLIIFLFALLDYSGVLKLLAPSQLADSGMGLGMIFIIGLITSVHCIAMCGGINLSQCLPQTNRSAENSRRFEALLPTFMYNLGRVISYTATGFLLGFIGMFVSGTGAGASLLLEGILKIAAGAFMVLTGLSMLDLFPFLRKFSARAQLIFGKKAAGVKNKSKRPLIVGLLNGLMPCGPLQSMQLVALASANPLIGAASMLTFGLGTLPLMLGFGSLVSSLGKKFARAVTAAGSVLVVVLGLSMLSQGGNLSGLFSFPYLFAAVVALFIIGAVSALPYRKTNVRALCTLLSVVLCAAAFTVFCIFTPTVKNNSYAVTAETADGVQIVRSTLKAGSYPDITVKANMPVKWIIDAPQESINGCNYRIIIREYGIEHTFTAGENIIEFTPDKEGNFSYSCWMGMIYGNILVIK